MAPLLEIDNLDVSFRLRDESIEVVSRVNLTIQKGEVLGIIGESGSGKTVTCLSLLRLLPDNAISRCDRMDFEGQDISRLSEREFRALRGRRMAMIFQDPVGAFNPAKTIAWHFQQVSRRVADLRPELMETSGAWRLEAVSVLRQAGIPHAEQILHHFPHQLSGGMLQRCLISLVLQMRPGLIVADEPTTNLDNIVERQIVELFAILKAQVDASFIFITHDISIAARICDRIAVMYAGQIVEIAETHALLRNPRHPYSQGLVRTSSELERNVERLKEIPGELPNWMTIPTGCRFEPRCPHASPVCRTPPPVIDAGQHQLVRCVLPTGYEATT